jgi:hypothetical protein
MPKKKLTADDYIHMPLLELAAHEDFDEKVLTKIFLFLDLTTDDIRNLIIPTKGS